MGNTRREVVKCDLQMNLLVLFPKKLWDSKMSMVRRHAIETMLARPEINVVLSGQGWEGYNTEISLRKNIARLQPHANAIFWYKPLGGKGIPPIIEPDIRDIPAVASYNEAWWPDHAALKECQSTRTDLVICHHKADMPQFEPPAGQRGPAVEWIPHAAKTSLFAESALAWSGRDIPCYLTGNTSAEVYPLRAKFKELLESKQIPGKIRRHPGYSLQSLAQCNKQAQEYAANLGKTKIALVCASKYNYGLAKYVEAAMAGACLLGDVPPDFAHSFGPHIIPVNSSMSLLKIKHVIMEALEDEDALARRAALGQQAAVLYHNMERYVTHLLYAIARLI